nr:hypothetical protein [Colwellia sp.]
VELSKIKSMLNDIAKARADLTDRTLRCHTYTKEILTESQWVKLLTIYKKKMG